MSKQQVIIEIGHISLLLPDDTGVASLIKTLSRSLIGYECGKKFKVTDTCRPKMSYPGKIEIVPFTDHISPEAAAIFTAPPKTKALPAPQPRTLRLL